MNHRANNQGKHRILPRAALSLLLTLAILCGLAAPALAFTPPTDESVVSTELFSDGYSDSEDAYEIYPVPHSVSYPGKEKFTMTKDVNVVIEDGIDKYTVAFLTEILADYGMTLTKSETLDPDKTNILLGVEGSKGAVDAAAQKISLTVEGLFDRDRNNPDLMTADRIDPYLLVADASENQHGVITILGRNSDCAYYGLATLQMMFSSFAGRRFLPVHIEDYSNVIYRGFIEGFYGVYNNPYPERESQIRAIRDVKANIYVFAAKGDPYHGGKWADLYPEEELQEIKHLVEVGLETKVQYAWSVHIGQGRFFSGVDSDSKENPAYKKKLAQLQAKFQQLYDVGVRNFHILNDDTNSGNNTQVVNLLNDMNAWRKEKGCRPIIYCCKGYNSGWAAAGPGSNGAELRALQALDPDIFLYWTGSDVNTPITQENIDFPRSRSNHYPVTWLNFPCSEHAGLVPFLGNANYYIKDANNLQNQKGIICNPVRNHSESTKVAFFQMLSWGWNRDDYASYSDELWENCFKYLQPEVYESYLTIARNLSNAPGSGRIPQNDNGFPESEYIKAALLSVKAKVLENAPLGDDQEVKDLLAELGKIAVAVDDFIARCENPTLVMQLRPWLDSLRSIAVSAKSGLEAAIALQAGDLDGAWIGMSQASVSLAEWGKRVENNRGGGSKRIKPFASAIVDCVTERITPLLNPDGMERIASFYAVLGGAARSDDSNSAKLFDGNPATVTEFHVNQVKGDYFGVDLGRVKAISAVDILQGKDAADHNYFHKAALECSSDGENWTILAPLVNSNHIAVSDLDLSARYVRLRLLETGYGDKTDYWTDIREFAVKTEQTGLAAPYSSIPLPEGTCVTVDGGVYTLPALEGLTLSAGDYVGVKLPEIMGIRNLPAMETLPTGLTLQYSASGVVWENGTPVDAVAARYVRMVNTSPNSVTANLPALSFAKSHVPFAPVMLKSNFAIYQTYGWANVFDGNTNTQAWTNGAQAAGQYVTFDLGASKPIHDIKIYAPETGDYPRGMSISLSSSPDGAWTTVGTIDNNMVIEPPRNVFTCDAGGLEARYLKLEITKGASSWLQIHEIELNKAHESVAPSLGAFSGNPHGEFEKALDGNLATLLTLNDIEAENGYFQYLLSDETALSGITALQAPGRVSNAVLTVQTKNGEWQSLGKLDSAAKNFETGDLGDILALRLNWAKGSSPAIAEIILKGASSGGGDASGEAPLLLPSIYEMITVAGSAVEVNYGTPIARVGLPAQAAVTLGGADLAHLPAVTLPVTWACPGYDGNTPGDYAATGTLELGDGITNPGCFALTATVTVRREAGSPEEPEEPFTGNLALKQPVFSSGTEVSGGNWTAEKAVDGDYDTDAGRWSAGPIMKQKNDMDAANQTSGGNWITVDLGDGKNTITEVKIKYNAKASGTKYDIQISDTNNDADWKTVATHETEPNDTQNATHTIAVSSAAIGRYVRVYYREMNINATQATGISIREMEVNGTKSFEQDGGDVGEPQNLALKTATQAATDIEVSGYEPAGPQGNKAVVADGVNNSDDIGARWSSNFMKSTAIVDGHQTPAWVTIDLGEDVAAITEVKAYYHKKVWPTDYDVDFSVNGTDWTTVKTFNREDSSQSDNLIDTVTAFETPVPSDARYIRLYFRTMNTPASGHCIGLRELEVNGTRYLPAVPVANPNVASVTPVTATGLVGTEFANLTLPQTVVATLDDGTGVSLPVAWDSTGYSDTSTAPQTITGQLKLDGTGITNTNNKTAALTVTLAAAPEIIAAAVNPGTLAVELGTEFTNLTLPLKAAAQLDNDLTVVCDVGWDMGGYSPDAAGAQSITGTLTPPPGVNNSNTVEASITLNLRDSVAPTIPTLLTISARTATTATLSWAASNDKVGVANYTVRGGASAQTVTGTTANLTGFTAGTDYVLRVTAQDTAGNASFASTVSFTTDFVVSDHSGNPVPNAVVALLQGSAEIASATTAVDGGYHFTKNIPGGIYTMTVTYDATPVTVSYLLHLAPGENAAQNITLPENPINTEVDSSGDVPALGIDGLNDVAESLGLVNGNTLSMAVTPADKPEDVATHVPAIKSAAQGRTIAALFNLDLSKTVDGVPSPITDTGSGHLTVAVPLVEQDRNKSGYTVYRYHDSKVDTLTSTANADGESVAIFENHLILRISKFSTYAIAYGDPVETDSTPAYRIRATATEGGTITPTATTVTYNGSKTFTITPEKDYRLTALTLNGENVDLTLLKGPDAKGAYTYTLEKVKKSHTLHAVFDVHHLWENFTDIGGHWAEEAIHYVSGNGLMTGTSATAFSPDGTTSRAMVVTTLWRLVGMPTISEGCPFTDVPADTWYTKAVAWAGESGLAGGVGDNHFAPTQEVTRQELAAFLFRYAQDAGIDVTVDGMVTLEFSDSGDVASWAAQAMTWVVTKGLVTGKPGNRLAPTDTASRAEFAAVLQRFSALVAK